MDRKALLLERVKRHLLPIENELSLYPRLRDMFHNCFMNSLETTMTVDDDGSVFFITGDIPAMWLRDSSEQVYHYVRFAANDPQIAEMICDVLKKQAELIAIDPYANAFNHGATDHHCSQDEPAPNANVWERKYEIDSLCHVIWLADKFYQCTSSTAFLTDTFHQAMASILHVFEVEQHHETQSDYYFIRHGDFAFETLPRNGKGNLTAETGMIFSGFRPSDDPCKYGYLIPANLFAASILKNIITFAGLLNDQSLANRAATLREAILRGIETYAYIQKPEGRIFAYEVDGRGSCLFMDDANIPSLLSLPYLGICDKKDPVYQRTRQVCLSSANPYYYRGNQAIGIGSRHTPDGYIWPIALCVQGITGSSLREKADILKMLMNTTGGEYVMHESFHPDEPEKYTRSWFAWANSMFAEFIYELYEEGELKTVLQMANE